MSDQRESFPRLRKSSDPQTKKEKRVEGPTPKTKDETIKTVSGLLSSKKDDLAQPARQRSIPLADLAGSLGEMAQRLKDRPPVRAGIDLAKTLVEPSAVKLADSGEKERSTHDEASPLEPFSAKALAGSRPTDSGIPGAASSSLNREPMQSAFLESPRSDPRKSGSESSDSSMQGEASRSLLSLAISHSIELRGSIDDNDSPEAGAGSQADAIRVEGGAPAAHSSGAVAISGISAIDRLRDSGTPKTAEDSGQDGAGGSPRSSPTLAESSRSTPARSLDPSMNFVRNPRSADMRNFAMMSSSAGPETGKSGLDLGALGIGPAEVSGGVSSSGSEAGAGDLSKTNELLQELVDAVRKQRSSSLPVGGPLVYADR